MRFEPTCCEPEREHGRGRQSDIDADRDHGSSISDAERTSCERGPRVFRDRSSVLARQ